MKRLGALLAGGASRRFGSDKAEALLDGRPLIEHAIAALRPLCRDLVIVGRTHPGLAAVADRPHPGMGPLGGIAGALRHAAERDFDAVLTVPVDCVRLPPDLLDDLSPPSAFLETQPVIGLWATGEADALDAWLAGESDRAVRAFARHIGARSIRSGFEPPNINQPEDLARLAGFVNR